jgi:hypothetical protein
VAKRLEAFRPKVAGSDSSVGTGEPAI